MAINLRELKTQKRAAALPPRILMYGPPGMAKTSLAAEFPNNIFIQTEDGTPGDREISAFPLCETYNDVIAYIGQLANEEHEFTTVTLDALDKFEPMLWEQVCADNKWASIEEPGYGKGYVECDRYWRYFLDGLKALRTNRGMTVIMIAHSTIERFDSPTSQAYNRYDIRLHKRAMALIQDDVDAIFFLNQDATIKSEKGGFNKESHRAEGGGTLWINTVGRPSFIAKNRYGLPEKILFKPFTGYEQIGPYLPAQVAEIGVEEEQAPAKPAKAKSARKAAKPTDGQGSFSEEQGGSQGVSSYESAELDAGYDPGGEMDHGLDGYDPDYVAPGEAA